MSKECVGLLLFFLCLILAVYRFRTRPHSPTVKARKDRRAPRFTNVNSTDRRRSF
jgi:hypothetical protein